MKNITLSIDENLLTRGRAYASKHHTSLNTLVRDLLKQTVDPPSTDWVDELVELSKQSTGNSNGWKWNREEIYDREICRHRKNIP
jgi:hypothetical protein